MDSKLELESKLKKGSTFHFDVEFKAENHIATIENNDGVSASEENNYQVLKPIILIVEDNKINMLLAKTIIKKNIPNTIIQECYNGIEAVDLCKKMRPNLIFMDIQMPLMNGYEATKEIRKLNGFEKIPIIALTAGTILGEKEKCLKSGMNDYVTKPVVQDTIVAIIQKWLDF